MAASIWGGGRMKRWHIQISWSLSMLDTIMVLSNLIDQSLAYPTPHVVYSGLWSKEVMCLWEKDSEGCDASLIELFYPYETMESLVGKHTASFAYDVYISSFTTLPNAPTPDRELHWFLSPKEWSEETWHLQLETWYEWLLEHQLDFCITTCRLFGLPFGPVQSFFSYWWKHNVFHPLGVLASLASTSYRSNDSLLSHFRQELICSYHIRLILNMSSFKTLLMVPTDTYNGSEWRSGIVINHFRDISNKVMSCDSIRTLSILFNLSCCC